MNPFKQTLFSVAFLLTLAIAVSCRTTENKSALADIKGTWYLNKWTSYHTLTFEESTVFVDNRTDTVFTLHYSVDGDLLVTSIDGKIMANKIIELTTDKLVLEGIHDVKEKRSYSRTRKEQEN